MKIELAATVVLSSDMLVLCVGVVDEGSADDDDDAESTVNKLRSDDDDDATPSAVTTLAFLSPAQTKQYYLLSIVLSNIQCN